MILMLQQQVNWWKYVMVLTGWETEGRTEDYLNDGEANTSDTKNIHYSKNAQRPEVNMNVKEQEKVFRGSGI